MNKFLIVIILAMVTFASDNARADFNGSFYWNTNWNSALTNLNCGTNAWGIYTNVWNTFSNYWNGCTNLWTGSSHEGCVQVITLSATTNAPAGAAGTASLRAEGDDQDETAIIRLKLSGLNPGPYNVSLGDITGTNAYDLGTINISTNNGAEEDDEFADSEHESHCYSGNTNTVPSIRASFPVPAGLDPTNIASIFVFDTNDVVLLNGSFTGQTNVAAVYYCETVSINPGTGTNATGQGTLKLSWKKGKTTGTFSLNASGLPAKKTLYLKADGKPSTTANTGTKGAVSLKSLPKTSLPDLHTVEAKDKQGNTVFSLEF